MRFAVILTIVLVWIFSLVNESGYGQLLHTGEKMNWLILAWALFLYVRKKRKFLPPLTSAKRLGFILFMVLIPYVLCGRWHGATYMLSFLVIFCFSNINISSKELSVSALAVGFLGLALITIYSRTSFLAGWNDNAIAMLALFSFIYFSIFFNTAKRKWVRFMCWGMAVAYIVQIFGTDSRGAALFMLLSVATTFFQLRTQKILSKSSIRALVIHLPLLIAVVVVLVSSMSWFAELDNWSLRNFDKTFFNGRDVLWADGFEDILRYPLGRGEFVINYHNSAVACIGVFGVLGYVLWSNFFKRQLGLMSEFMEDYTVYACMCSFIIIYLQQSVELGFLNQMPNMMPYMILGLGLGKVRWLIWKQ